MHATITQYLKNLSWKSVWGWARKNQLLAGALVITIACAVFMLLMFPVYTAATKPLPVAPAPQVSAPEVAPKLPSRDDAPHGLGRGAWVYNLAQVEDGDMVVAAAKAKDHGLRHLVVKVNQGGERFSACDLGKLRQLRDACRRQKILLFGYGYLFGDKPDEEAKLAKEALRTEKFNGLDLDGYVLDIEKECEAPGKLEAVASMLKTVRCWKNQNAKYKILAYSSFGIPGQHSNLPWEAMNNACDYAMPQLYWADWQRSQHWDLNRSLVEALLAWNRCPITVVPTVQSYGPGHTGIDTISPAKLTWFLKGLNTSEGFNTFRWELTGLEQWKAIGDFECDTARVAPSLKYSRAKAPRMPLQPVAAGPLTGLTVVLDPGHGGSDSSFGWQSPDGTQYREATLTYMIVAELSDLVRSQGATVFLTSYSRMMKLRQVDAQESLPEPEDAVFLAKDMATRSGTRGLRTRVAEAKKAKAYCAAHGLREPVYVSVHVDSEGNKSLMGVHVIRPVAGSNPLANALGTEINNRGIGWNSPVGIVHTPTGGGTTLVLDQNVVTQVALVEAGVPNNTPHDNWRLRSPACRSTLLEAIAAALEKINQPAAR